MKKLLLTFALFLGVTTSLRAELKLPKAIADHMILQRDTQVNLWGWAEPWEIVTIETSWNNKKYSAEANQSGEWKVKVATALVGGSHTISFSAEGKTIKISDVLLGEVWVCSGQSNMFMRLWGNYGSPTEGGFEAILKSAQYRDKVRVLNVDTNDSDVPLDDLKGAQWYVPNAKDAYGFAAVPYFFAMNLSDMLDVPVGVISTCWGGARIEAWMAKEDTQKVTGFDAAAHDEKYAKQKVYKNNTLYNGMIAPLENYTARGFLWYQGESNRMDYKIYPAQFEAMIAGWRERWGNEKMPIYMAQLAPYRYTDANDNILPLMVEAQLKITDKVPNTGVIPTLDLGEETNIHPGKKYEVGLRFANMAMVKTYGMTFSRWPASGARVTKCEVKGSNVELTYDHKGGFYVPEKQIKGFMIAGADKKFYPAKAVVAKRPTRVVVSSDKVKVPVAVRYAFKNYVTEATLFDDCGLPAFPYRSDDWDDIR